MKTEVLATLGQLAGVGGIALGVLLLVFRDVIRKNVFSKLTKRQSYNLLRLILVLVWSIALLGVVTWAYGSLVVPQSESKQSVGLTDLGVQSVLSRERGNIGKCLEPGGPEMVG